MDATAIGRRSAARAIGTVLFGAIALGLTGSAEVGCTAAQWANFVTVATQFVAYVQTFLQTAAAIWPQIVGLLGSNAPAADAVFKKAYATVTDALGALQQGIAAATIAQQPNPDLAALIQAVQQAVSDLMAVVNQYRATAGGVAVGQDEMAVQARVIANWRTK